MYHNFEPPPNATAAAVAVDVEAESEPNPDPATLADGRPTSVHVGDGPMTVDGIDLPDMMYHNFDPPSLPAMATPDQGPHEPPPSAAAADVGSEGYVRPLERTVGDSLPPGSATGDPPAGSDIGSECESILCAKTSCVYREPASITFVLEAPDSLHALCQGPTHTLSGFCRTGLLITWRTFYHFVQLQMTPTALSSGTSPKPTFNKLQ